MKLIFKLLLFANVCLGQDTLLDETNPLHFQLNFTEYNQATALFCAQISKVAYWEERNISIFYKSSVEKYPEFNIHYKLINDTYGIHHNQVLLWGCKDFLLVAFRGTEPSVLKDWLTDSKYWNYENSDGFNDQLNNMPAGHGGFRRSLMRLMIEKKLIEEIKSLIVELNPKSSVESFPVYLSGHSLGAGLSQLFILPLKYSNLNFKGAYHFAPPLAVTCEINSQMRDSFGSIVYDIINYKDYVPRAGRKNVGHFGKFYRICDDGLVYKEDEAYVKFNISEYFSEFKLHSLSTHLDFLRKEENNVQLINRRSVGHFPCMDLQGDRRISCE